MTTEKMTEEMARRILTPGNGDEGVRYGQIAAKYFLAGRESMRAEIEGTDTLKEAMKSDALAEENKKIRAQIDSLRSSLTPEVEALVKAAKDALPVVPHDEEFIHGTYECHPNCENCALEKALAPFTPTEGTPGKAG